MQTTEMRNETTAHAPHPGANGKPLMGLFSDLWRETSTLVHDEAELAKAEISEKVSQVTTGAAEIAVAGAVAFGGFLVLLSAAVGALELMIGTEHAIWIAPLIVGLVVLAIGYILLKRGQRNLKARNLMPGRTIQAMRDNADLARRHAS